MLRRLELTLGYATSRRGQLPLILHIVLQESKVSLQKPA
jgi:hypothetical protein